MGLRCSLFGHAFEEPVTERDRETRGAEVVITVREVQTCRRCGTEQVIAENTEVRRLGPEEREETGASETSDTGTAAEDRGPSKADTTGPVAAESPEDDAATADTDEDISQYVEAAEGPETTEPAGGSASAEEPDSAVESEDAEFIDSGPESGDEAADADDETPEESVADTAAPGDRDAGAEGAESASETGSPAETEAGPGTGDETEVVDADSGAGTGEETEVVDADSGAGTGEETEVVDADSGAGTGEESGFEEAAPESQVDDGDEDEPDDAIIMDNTPGAEDREADIGRRELAGTGNMFDPSAPEDGDGESPRRESQDAGYDAEPVDEESPDWPAEGTEQDDPEPGADELADHEEWPGSGREEPPGQEDESAFQFGPDMQKGEPDTGEEPQKSPSGITTEGPVDVTGPAEDSPPRTVICPECGYETRAIGSSLRAGDICPECHAGYLAERR
jgi:hypothetical protein